ncbi:hypothetical protein FRX31_004176 [Thalictrum thalictroides]|uniref:Uncharacterized protein n=1 Tax=Thalictrum thalictroides TaxID=46969 RepID=A0A7J6XBE4_THATH|nr:hypothetical protein FRX31_004176 [Thalictrum thalictroides]
MAHPLVSSKILELRRFRHHYESLYCFTDKRGGTMRQYIPDANPIDHDAHLRVDSAAIFARLTTRYALFCSKHIYTNLKKYLIQHLWNRKGDLPDGVDDN